MIYDQKFARNSYSANQQNKIRSATYAIIGLGGTGGFIFENLLRQGAEKFILFDPDRFELTNFNRQILATDQTIDKKKTKAAVERARSINKSVKIKCYGKFDSNLHNADIVIDGSDNVETKIQIAKAARAAKIPYVFCSASFSRGIVSLFKNYKFEKAFHIDPDLEYKKCASIISPAASMTGSLAASLAVNYLIQKPCIRAPDALFFDLFKKEIFWRAELG
ncbi:MAG: ThiF family adenylyltransferase [Candidatus Micrarchaeota archaeon]